MPGTNLTRQEASARSAAIEVFNYDVSLDLTGGPKTFESTTVIDFDAREDSTFVDLIATEVHSIELNGESLDTSCYRDSRIELTGLKERNQLRVHATCQYMHTGEGLHRFTDPADGEDYCYSQFEVPDARRVFTVFEQPDLKAQFTFHVTAPSHWIVLSNSPTPEPVDVEGARRWDFSATERISSYITAIIAGPYVGKTSSLTSSDGREIPLGVYCRPSLLEHLDAEWMFDVTRQGFAFFEKEYGHPYPFRKYDQIFVPEYNAGAMENAGCVTFRDQYIFRSRPTAADLEGLANTVLHELAHMWFGDLVTMKWWNDLWLNESFAEFMSHLCLVEGTRQWPHAWTGFMARKDWGLRQDQLPSTHPIVAPIRDLEDVEVNFDGITYAKGAAVLRQLVSYVGREAFTAGLRTYFEKHAWSNTTLADLLAELAAASGRDLNEWSAKWLETSGVTLLRPEIDTDGDGRIRTFTIIQEPFSPGTKPRPHRLAVGGYSEQGGKVERVFHTELDVDGEATEVSDAAGIERPDFLLINDGDLAYAKVRMDPQSLAFATTHIAQFTDPLTRGIILACAWDMLRDAKMNAGDYCDLVLSAIPTETDITMLNLALRHLDTAIVEYASNDTYRDLAVSVADRLLLLARSAEAKSDSQRLLTMAAARRATTDEQAQAIERLRTGEDSLAGLEMDVDLKWELVIAGARTGVLGEEQIAEMEREDTTLTGAQKATRARAARGDQAVKDAAHEALLFDQELSNDMRISTGMGYWQGVVERPELFAANAERFFDSLEKVWAENTFHTADSIVTLGFPSFIVGRLADVDVVGMASQWLDEHADAPAGLRRLVSENLAEAKRSLAVREA